MLRFHARTSGVDSRDRWDPASGERRAKLGAEASNIIINAKVGWFDVCSSVTLYRLNVRG